MNEQTIFRLRDILRATTLTSNDASLLILLVFVWSRQASHSMDLSPQQLLKGLESLAASHPVLAHTFIDRGLLRQVTPATLALAAEAVQVSDAQGLAPKQELVDLPHLLGLMFSCDPSLPTLIGRLVAGAPGDLVYLPWDDTGQFGAALAARGARMVAETPSPTVVAILMSMLHPNPWQIEHANPIIDRGTRDQLDSPYEAAAAILPLGLRIDMQWLERAVPGRFPERTTSAAVLGVRQLLAVTRTRIVVAVPNSLLFSSGAENSLREDLLRHGLLRAVVALPGGLLTGTTIPLSVLIIDLCGGLEQVRFVNADTQRFKKTVSRSRTTLNDVEAIARLVFSATEEPDTATVSARDLLKNGSQLQVNRYVVPEAIARAQAMLAEVQTARLEDVVEFLRSPPIAGDAEVDSSDEPRRVGSVPAHEVTVSDLPAFGFVTTPGRRVWIDPKADFDTAALRKGDIILVVKGSVGRVGIVSGAVESDDTHLWFASQSAIVLRVRDPSRMDPRALFMQLRSPLGQQLLKGIVSGATVPLIQLKELRKLLVIAQDPATQQRATSALEEEANLECQITELREQQAFQTADLWQLA